MDHKNTENAAVDLGLQIMEVLQFNPFYMRSFASSVVRIRDIWEGKHARFLRDDDFYPGQDLGFLSPWELRTIGRFVPEASVEYMWATIFNRVKVSPNLSCNDYLESANGYVCTVDFQRSLHDRSSEIASNGFFDRNDLPPSDCWIGLISEQLIFWTPESLVDLLVRGIEANCVDVIRLELEKKGDVISPKRQA